MKTYEYWIKKSLINFYNAERYEKDTGKEEHSERKKMTTE